MEIANSLLYNSPSIWTQPPKFHIENCWWQLQFSRSLGISPYSLFLGVCSILSPIQDSSGIVDEWQELDWVQLSTRLGLGLDWVQFELDWI